MTDGVGLPVARSREGRLLPLGDRQVRRVLRDDQGCGPTGVHRQGGDRRRCASKRVGKLRAEQIAVVVKVSVVDVAQTIS